MNDKQDYEWILKTIRAHYKIPDSIQDLPTMKEWLKRMGANKFLIQRMEQAYEKARM